MRWLRPQTAARILDCHRSTIWRRKLSWQPGPVAGLFRFKDLVLDDGSEPQPRFFWPDIRTQFKYPELVDQIDFGPIFPRAPRLADSHAASNSAAAEGPLLWRIVTAANHLDLSRDAIEDRIIDWQTDHVPHRIRCSPGSIGHRLCFPPDVEALLIVPAGQGHTDAGGGA